MREGRTGRRRAGAETLRRVRYPDEVAGLVLRDVPAGQANLTTADVGTWDSPENPERMDYVAIEPQMALARRPSVPIGDRRHGAGGGRSSDPDEQKVWLEGSSHPVHLVLERGHESYEDDPAGVLGEIAKVLEHVRSR